MVIQFAGMKKTVFNYRLSRGRNVSENCFRILVRKFRVFEHKLNMLHEHINSVVIAACCLHNFLRNDSCHWTECDINVSLFLNEIGDIAPAAPTH
ncbi:hypothetical protein NQ314_001561 [Rhamnusium bicolor]|uniref:DDE Tnp4 domain-containing protein n=1 Tax=Rhamnusium bicolor TaxID=1586634 RepID=A0AAV8ZTH0_9CUCU|nr:hypothetical protein NQ314_001561 [Rhamnusium bicolor]